MSEYIAEVVQNQYGEATILKEKLTRCKDCKWWKPKENECIEWYDSPYAPADGYCFRAERKRK